jgi:tetratricopeptide (TPR) repeat protein
MYIGSPAQGEKARKLGNPMAFGFGFKKQKVLSAAEKCVQQGKLQNAIAEYEKILKNDAKDLTVLNTVGDLYARLGETDKAAECFKNVGDAYASQGFTVKAIAMYKKLSKLKTSTECVLRLAELYTQQGLFNDARAQYLQVAEEFLKSGQFDQAVRIFEKTLEMDPENIAMRKRLAEVYVRLGKKPEAWKILTAAAESLRAKGQLAAADEILERMLKLEPGNSYALVLRGRAALDAGDSGAAIEALSHVPDLDSNAEGLRILFQAYLRARKFPEAGTLAQKLAEVHNESSAMTEYADALVEAHEYRAALAFYEQHSEELLRKEPSRILERLRPIITHVQDDPEGLESVLSLFEKSGENTQLTETYELLAHAYVQAGDLEKARDMYLRLTQLEPANQMHVRNYQQVIEKLGGSDTPHLITPEEGAMLADELEATAPFIDQRYDDEVALVVRAALTDAELYISYNMPAKATAPLLSALPKAPRDLRLNQKLAALHIRGGRFSEAAGCCRTLEGIYREAGHTEEAARYAELAAKHEERGSASAATPEPQAKPAESPTAEFEISSPLMESAPEEHPAPVPEPPPIAAPVVSAPSGLFFHGATPSGTTVTPSITTSSQLPEFSVASHPEATEIDLSGEWEQGLTTDAPIEEKLDASETDASIPSLPASELSSLPTVDEEPEAAPSEAPAIASAPSQSEIAEMVEEIRFYLGQGLTEPARQLLSKLEALSPQSPELAVLRQGIESASQAAAFLPEEAEISIEEPGSSDEVAPEEIETVIAHSSPELSAEPSHQQAPILADIASEIEQALGTGFMEVPAPAESTEFVEIGDRVESADLLETADTVGADTEEHDTVQADTEEHDTVQADTEEHDTVQADTVEHIDPAEVAPAMAEVASHEFRSGSLDDFVADLEASLGNDFLADSAAEPLAPAAPAVGPAIRQEPLVRVAVAASSGATPELEIPSPSFAAKASTPSPTASLATVVSPATAAVPAAQPPMSAEAMAGVDLSNLFGDLKQELEGDAASPDEDPETHYNLGVAFREMGLLDEAIAEFQKVCQSAERGHPFAQLMQTYTWLAQCFLDKGVPEAAIRWYQKALELPSLDQETRTALHYELASAFEIAGNNSAALSNFMEVYGSNIDYRDVAERIKALKP